MGKNEFTRTLTGSDSGYGDDATRKGYEIGPASKLQIGDVFEFLWADCPEFEHEWKCLGYTRFIVLRHSDSFPHYCACVPISVGGKRDFAKPGVDILQQGHVYASGEKSDRDRDGPGTEAQSSHQPQKTPPQLPYSSVGISLRSGRHRVKEDSRANYSDVVEVDHEAQVMVIGDVSKYFDRVRKNVNKAFMRQVLREALEPYCQRKKSESAAAGVRGWGNSTAALTKVTDEDRDRDHEQHGQPETGCDSRQPDCLSPGGAANLEKDAEDFFSDTTREEEEEEWEGSQQSPLCSPRIHEERRAFKTTSRARAKPETPTAVRPGMDKAGLSSLRSLRSGLPGGDDHDDARSLRSLAMVGRSDSFESRKSRK